MSLVHFTSYLCIIIKNAKGARNYICHSEFIICIDISSVNNGWWINNLFYSILNLFYTKPVLEILILPWWPPPSNRHTYHPTARLRQGMVHRSRWCCNKQTKVKIINLWIHKVFGRFTCKKGPVRGTEELASNKQVKQLPHLH